MVFKIVNCSVGAADTFSRELIIKFHNVCKPFQSAVLRRKLRDLGLCYEGHHSKGVKWNA